MQQQTPQVVEVDPQRIKFSKHNPRPHGGTELVRLKQSVKETGIVQLPTVRVLPGGFYEAIDGEGRIRSKQEEGASRMYVVSYGQVSDEDALAMMQAANSVRSFGFLAECRGMANMHRAGKTGEAIAAIVGEARSYVQMKIAVGYFPESILKKIEQDALSSEERAAVWQPRMFLLLVPLRRQVEANNAANVKSLDGFYGYEEVEKAVEMIIHSEITTPTELKAYSEERRRELFEQRFDAILRERVEREQEEARAALQAAYEQQMQGIAQATANRYESQVHVLQDQLAKMEQRMSQIVSEVAKRPEIVEKREKELSEKVQQTEAERKKLQHMQSEVETERRRIQEQLNREIQEKLAQAMKQQKAELERQHQQTEADLKAYYERKDRERQLAAERSVRQMVSHLSELLAQSRQSLLLIASPNIRHGLSWLPQAEQDALEAEMRSTVETLSQTLDTITQTV